MRDGDNIFTVIGEGEGDFTNKGYTVHPEPQVQGLSSPVVGPATPPPTPSAGDTAQTDSAPE